MAQVVLVCRKTAIKQTKNCQYSYDLGRLQAGAYAPTVDIAANKNSSGSDLDPSRIADTNGGRSRPASSSSSSS